MNQENLAKIEKQLGISLPTAYRELFAARSMELRKAGCFTAEFCAFYNDCDEVIDNNLGQREKDSGTEYAFKKWWKRFFLIGDNGGGDFYCLRVNNKPGVWMIGSDCGNEPTLIEGTLNEYIDELIAEHEASKQREAERVNRQAAYEPEMAAHRKAIKRGKGPQVAYEFMDCQSGYVLFKLLDQLEHKPSPRKLRLYGIASCRNSPDIKRDKLLTAALKLAEQTTVGNVSEKKFAAMEKKLRANLHGANDYQTVRAVHHLFQTDHAYLTDAPIYPDDPVLTEVYNSASYTKSGLPYGDDQSFHLLREVLGNPFHPVEFESNWRSEAVLTLADEIFANETFERMPELANELVAAGCKDARVIEHCKRTNGHVRGCWVLDLILENEPDPEAEFQWDFECTHPNVDAKKLKRQLQNFGAAGKYDRNDDKAVQRFANWLKKNGDHVWAEYIEIRLKLDGHPPGDDYFDLHERLMELADPMRSKIIKLENIYFSGYRFGVDEWWELETDDMDRGLPALVHAVIPSDGEGHPKVLRKRIDALTNNTPIRGMDFESYFSDSMAQILSDPAAQRLRWLGFSNKSDGKKSGSVMKAICDPPTAQTLERLMIQYGIRNDADANNLAKAPFDSLRRMDFPFGDIACSAKAVKNLMTAPWFLRLGQINVEFGAKCRKPAMKLLAAMPHLHSLRIKRTAGEQILALPKAGEFSQLRRLSIANADLRGETGLALCQMQAPLLQELWLQHCRSNNADLKQLFTSSLLANLRSLTLAGPRLNDAGMKLLAKSPFATTLRCLRLKCGDHNLEGNARSLASLIGEFPELTTLHIEYPYKKKKADGLAEFLANVQTPKLKHLHLDQCTFDDKCGEVVGQNANFANLTRLVLNQRDSSYALSEPAAQKLFQSPILNNLVVLDIKEMRLGNSVDVLAKQGVMPNLLYAGGWGCGVPSNTLSMLEKKRPIVRFLLT